MELTQEYFDKKLAGLATKDDLKTFATKEDLKSFATKDDLRNQTAELKTFAQEQTDTPARIIATSVAVPLEAHLSAARQETSTDIRIQNLEQDVLQIKQVLHLST